MSVITIGSFCFGTLIGWVTCRTLYRVGESVALSSIASVLGAVGGAAVMAVAGGGKPFAWYCIGMAGSFFASLVLVPTIFRERYWLGNEMEELVELSSQQELRSVPYDVTLPAPAERVEQAWRNLDLEALLLAKLPDWLTQRQIQPRYGNAVVFGLDNEQPLDPRFPLRAGEVVRLRLDIGPLSPESQVTAAWPDEPLVAFPDDRLPANVNLDVMVSSTDFEIAPDLDGVIGVFAKIVHDRFFLPGSGGGPAITATGGRYLNFYLALPPRPGQVRARIGYYYRSNLIQSQQLMANIEQEGGFEIKTDFTLSDDLTRLENFPERPRISILTNANGDGTHQIVLRKPATRVDPTAAAETFAISEKNVGRTVDDLRAVLRDRAPTARHRRPSELREDLAQLAPKGFRLWAQVPGQHPHMFQPLLKDPGSFVVQVSRPTTSGFVFPWSLIYDIPLNSEKPAFCRLVTEWDGKKPLVSGPARQCPYGPHKENVLCPFGFWGFRYSIDQLPSAGDSVFSISVPDKWSFVVAETQYGIDIKALASHVGELRTTLQNSFPNAQIQEGKTKSEVRDLLGSDLPLVYFYCHGEKLRDADPDTFLGVGKNESIPATEWQGWVQTWLMEDKVIWNGIRPLVFINACHSLEIHPESLVSYLDAFVGTARAAGVIGTEVKVNQDLAMKIAERFFELLLVQKKTVDEALRTIRLDYLADGNLMGLLYTPYCWAELRIAN